jgi:hypothetical protein
MKAEKSNTSSALAEMTLASFQASHPDLFAEITRMGLEAGRQSTIEQLKAISALAPGELPFVIEEFAKGETLDQVKDSLIDRLAEALAKKQTGTQLKTEPVLQEFADGQAQLAGTAAEVKDAEPEGVA